MNGSGVVAGEGIGRQRRCSGSINHYLRIPSPEECWSDAPVYVYRSIPVSLLWTCTIGILLLLWLKLFGDAPFLVASASSSAESWLLYHRGNKKKSSQSVKNTAWNPWKLFPEPTRVSGYGSRRFPLPSSVSVATTTTITTTTTTTVTTAARNKHSKAPPQRVVHETELVANPEAAEVATLFVQPWASVMHGDSKHSTTTTAKRRSSLSSTRELQIHCVRRNVTVSIQSTLPSVKKDSHSSSFISRQPALEIRSLSNSTSRNNSTDPADFAAAAVDLSSWIPVQGLYGVYPLPSGHVYVWIVDSEPIYDAPPSPSGISSSSNNNQMNNAEHSSSSSSSSSWWSIRRVTELYLTRVVVVGSDDSNSSQHSIKRQAFAQRQEEKRQLTLLRQALKHHEWYYCSAGAGTGAGTKENRGSDDDIPNFVIPDMTRNLQSNLLLFQEQQNKKLLCAPSKDESEYVSSRATTVSVAKNHVPCETNTEIKNALRTDGTPRGGSAAAVGQEMNHRVVANSSRLDILSVRLNPAESNATNATSNVQSQSQWRRWWGRFLEPANAGIVQVDTLIHPETLAQHNSSYTSVSGNVITTPKADEKTIVATQETESWHDDLLKPSALREEILLEDAKELVGASNTESLHQKSLMSFWEVPNKDINQNVAPTQTVHPDARFFWNDAAVEPLRELHSQQQPSINIGRSDDTPPAAVLLELVIPVTSAFCGIQTNLSITDPENNATSTPDSSNLIHYDQLLITRRSRFRAGTRFTRRGADATGAVANYAETEQVVFVWQPRPDDAEQNNTNTRSTAFTDDRRELRSVASHVQTRGSIPLRWSSPTDIKTYRPRIHIGTDPLAQARAVRQHLADQASHYIFGSLNDDDDISHVYGCTIPKRKYPALLFVNLIDKHSDQGRLGRALDAVLTAVLDVYSRNGDDTSHYGSGSASSQKDFHWLNHALIQHLWFDFHAEVKSGRWDRLEGLLTSVKPTLDEQGYCRAGVAFSSEIGRVGSTYFQLQKLQTGVVRTNCMDCLDRTNVVQSMFARYMLFCQLTEDHLMKSRLYSDVGLAHKRARATMVLPWSAGEIAHRFLWADNADAISRLYAGTSALKGDFTRTGKRTKKGALDDGMNSLQRYYLNNFLDADRQEGVDLLTGHRPFNNLEPEIDHESATRLADGDSEEKHHNEDSDSAAFRGLRRKGMTVQDAARQMLLNVDPSVGFFDEDADSDNDHVRIKFTRHETKREGSFFTNRKNASWQSRRALDLRWLPGDLQSQVRSLISSSLASQQYPSTSHSCESMPSAATGAMNTVRDLLLNIDERSTSDMPWWVIAETSDTEASSEAVSEEVGNNVAARAQMHEMVSSSSNSAGGYLIAALVAGVQKPLVTAAAIMVLVATAFPLSTEEHFFKRQGDEESIENDETSESEDEDE